VLEQKTVMTKGFLSLFVRPAGQGDQIGRIFACWVTVFSLGSFCENYTIIWATFSMLQAM
jgi:hypothetical protein